MNKLYTLLVLAAVLLSPLAPGRASGLASPPAPAQPHAPAGTQPVANKELVRNGSFDKYGQYNAPLSWVKTGTGSGVEPTGGQDGGPAMKMEAISELLATLYQQVYLPTQTTAATLAFDYRLKPSPFAVPSPLPVARFFASVVTATGLITNVFGTPYTYADTGWQSVSVALTANDVSRVQAAHAAGQGVYVIFSLFQAKPTDFYAYVDNVSFRVSGSMNIPAWGGSIAYIGYDGSGYSKTVRRIKPDGSGQQIVWTHPSDVTPHIYDVAWKPDAGELAFSSDHEFAYSAFHSDAYGVKPDGSGLRRITNPPSKAELQAGGYQMGTVTGKVHNNYGSVTTMLLYIEGAQEAVSIPIGGQHSEASFEVQNVADLGVGLHYVVFEWGNPSCANGKEYAAAVVDVEPGQTVDAGTLYFGGTCGKYETTSVAWKRDGSELGFFVGSQPRKVPAAGQAIGTDLFNAGTVLAGELAWSPVNDQILYRRNTFDANSGIYLTTAGGGIGELKVSDRTGAVSAIYATPAWLPDGSGFVYSLDHYLYQYDLAASQVITLAYFSDEYVLNPSLSPDGRYVVFEWQVATTPIQRDLWILDRQNPVEMWQVTSDGRSGNPDWSRVDPSSCAVPLTGVGISGPTTGYTGTAYAFTAVLTPSTATPPITYAWSPAPTSGQGTASAIYTWATTGAKTITLTAGHCGGSRTGSHTITINPHASGVEPRNYLPLVLFNAQ